MAPKGHVFVYSEYVPINKILVKKRVKTEIC